MGWESRGSPRATRVCPGGRQCQCVRLSGRVNTAKVVRPDPSGRMCCVKYGKAPTVCEDYGEYDNIPLL